MIVRTQTMSKMLHYDGISMRGVWNKLSVRRANNWWLVDILICIVYWTRNGNCAVLIYAHVEWIHMNDTSALRFLKISIKLIFCHLRMVSCLYIPTDNRKAAKQEQYLHLNKMYETIEIWIEKTMSLKCGTLMVLWTNMKDIFMITSNTMNQPKLKEKLSG